MVAGTGGGGAPMESDALLFRVPTVAVIVMIVFTTLAVNVTVATPVAFVVAVVADRLPAVPLLTANVTTTPLIPPRESDTVADTVVLPGGTGIEEDPRDTTTEVGTRGGVPITRAALPLTVPVPTCTDARMVTLELLPAASAVKVDVTAPDALVTAAEGLKEPAVALITEKVTFTFGITCPEESRTVAVTDVAPRFAMADEPRDT